MSEALYVNVSLIIVRAFDGSVSGFIVKVAEMVCPSKSFWPVMVTFAFSEALTLFENVYVYESLSTSLSSPSKSVKEGSLHFHHNLLNNRISSY